MSPLWLEINRWGVTPWEWGRMDCMISLADWCVAQGWPDPAHDVRLTYSSAGECQRATGFLRDPLTVTQRCFGGAGLPVVAEAAVGDIAVLKFAPTQHVGAVWTDIGQWASKDEHHSVTYFKPAMVPQVLRVWGVGYAA